MRSVAMASVAETTGQHAAVVDAKERDPDSWRGSSPRGRVASLQESPKDRERGQDACGKGMGDGSGCHCGCRPPTLWGSSRLGGAVMGALCVAPAYRRRETGWGGRHRPSKPRLYASETFLVLDRSSLSSGSWAPPAHEPPGRSRHCEVAGPTLVEPRHTAAPCA